jgi:hypothetical protein
MKISLELLQALAVVNPYLWEGLTQEELDARIEAAELRPFLIHYPTPGPASRPGIGKTIVTKAVIERIAQEDPTGAQDLRNRCHKAFTSTKLFYRDAASERVVFERIDQLVAKRTREALTAFAGQRSSDEVVRRAI